MSVGVIQSDMEPEERRAAYGCDVTYVTNQEVGFDYLRDNMATDSGDLVMDEEAFNFAIVDEVDSELIDEGRNPLITGPGDEGDEEMTKYTIASEVAAQLRENLDYVVDLKQKTADLTERGMMVAEQLLGVADQWTRSTRGVGRSAGGEGQGAVLAGRALHRARRSGADRGRNRPRAGEPPVER